MLTDFFSRVSEPYTYFYKALSDEDLCALYASRSNPLTYIKAVFAKKKRTKRIKAAL